MTPGMEALAEAARIEAARVYGTTCREPNVPRRDRVTDLIDRLQQAGPPVTDLTAHRSTARPTPVGRRVRIETAIARTGTVEAAAEATGEPLAAVRAVWEAMSA